MNILALETSLPSASLCLFAEGRVCFRAQWHTLRNHDADLFPALQRAMDQLDGAPLHRILVGAGPGSYGGVRVSLAAAAGIGLVTGASVVAVPSWDQFSDGDTCIISDARRGGWTLRSADGRIQVVTTDDIRQLLMQGTPVATVETEETLEKHGLKATRYGLIPTAEGLVQSWLALSDEQRAALEARPAEPIYVRPPHITEAKHKPWEIRN